MTTRIISGLIGGFLTLAVLFFDQSYPWLINLVTAAVCVLAVREIFAVCGISKIYILTIPTLIFAPLLPLMGLSELWELGFYLYSLIIFSSMLISKNVKLKETCIVYSLTILISFSLFKMVDLRNFGGEYGSFYVFLALAIAWISDTGAYFSGKFFGKNKLCPEISPKKTLEGFVGGILFCLTCVILTAFIFNNFVFPEKQKINYVLVIALALIGSLISSLGDLCFSAVKRRCRG